VLFRQVKDSTKQRYGSSDRTASRSKGATRSNTVVVTAHRSRKDPKTGAVTLTSKNDDGSDRSDRSILAPNSQSDIAGNKIMQVQEVAVKYHLRGDEEECTGYELGQVRRM